MKESKILWQSKTNNSQTFIRLIISFLIISIILFMIFGLLGTILKSTGGNLNGVWVFLIQTSLPILFIFFLFGSYMYKITIAYTVKYEITENNIQFKWGWLKKRKAIITYNNIDKISLVNFKEKPYSTLYIDTKTSTKALAIDFVTGKERHCPTLEKVSNGKIAYELIEKFRLRNMI